MDENAEAAEKDRLVKAKETEREQDRIEGSYSASKKRKTQFILLMSVTAAIAFVCSLAIGSVNIPFSDTLAVVFHHIFPAWVDLPSKDWYDDIVMNSRLPRTLLCLLTGFSLAAAGTVMQGLLRNPLVSPFTLGVSTAASFGAAMTIVFGSELFGSWFHDEWNLGFASTSAENILLVAFAFMFGLVSILLVLKIASKNASRATLILAGVVISYLFSAGISLSQYVSDDEALRKITNWLMGGMWNATWGAVIVLTPIVIICTIYLEKISLDINSLSAGDEIARNVGLDVYKLRRNGLIVCTLVSAACVAFTGVIGFIGLMAPHMIRMVIGNDTRYVIPASALLGSSILMVSDVISRVILRPEQIPVGIIMYVIGGIFFLWMISGKRWRDRL